MSATLRSNVQLADEQFNVGIRAFERRAYAEAVQALRQSFQLDPHYKTAAVLGQSEAALGNADDAATWLAWALRFMPESDARGVRIQMQAELDRLKAEVMVVTLLLGDNNARLTVDGVEVPITATNGTQIYLEPGAHEIVLVRDHREPFRARVQGARGSATTISVPEATGAQLSPQPLLGSTPGTLAVPARSESKTSSLEADTPTTTTNWLLPTAVATSVAALGAAGVGLYWYQTARQAERDIGTLASTLREREGIAPCSPDAAMLAPECQALTDRDEKRVWNANASTGAFVAAGVLAAASAGLWVWLWSNETKHDEVVSRFVLTQTSLGDGLLVSLYGQL